MEKDNVYHLLSRTYVWTLRMTIANQSRRTRQYCANQNTLPSPTRSASQILPRKASRNPSVVWTLAAQLLHSNVTTSAGPEHGQRNNDKTIFYDGFIKCTSSLGEQKIRRLLDIACFQLPKVTRSTCCIPISYLEVEVLHTGQLSWGETAA